MTESSKSGRNPRPVPCRKEQVPSISSPSKKIGAVGFSISPYHYFFQTNIPKVFPALSLKGPVRACWLSRVRLFATRAVAHQPPLSMGFPRQEFWSGLPFPSPGLKDLEIPLIQHPVVFTRVFQRWTVRQSSSPSTDN